MKFQMGDRVYYAINGLTDVSTAGTVVHIERDPGIVFYHVEWDDVDYTKYTASVYRAHDLEKA